MPVHFPHNDCMIEAVLKEGCVHSDLKEFCAQQFRKNSATYLRYVSSWMTVISGMLMLRL